MQKLKPSCWPEVRGSFSGRGWSPELHAAAQALAAFLAPHLPALHRLRLQAREPGAWNGLTASAHTSLFHSGVCVLSPVTSYITLSKCLASPFLSFLICKLVTILVPFLVHLSHYNIIASTRWPMENKSLLLTVSESEKFNIKAPAVSMYGEGLLNHRQLSSL